MIRLSTAVLWIPLVLSIGMTGQATHKPAGLAVFNTELQLVFCLTWMLECYQFIRMGKCWRRSRMGYQGNIAGSQQLAVAILLSPSSVIQPLKARTMKGVYNRGARSGGPKVVGWGPKFPRYFKIPPKKF